MFAIRRILDPETVRAESFAQSEARLLEAKALSIATSERLGELYANLDPDNEPEDAIRIADMEGECERVNALYDTALTRYGWEMSQLQEPQS